MNQKTIALNYLKSIFGEELKTAIGVSTEDKAQALIINSHSWQLARNRAKELGGTIPEEEWANWEKFLQKSLQPGITVLEFVKLLDNDCKDDEDAAVNWLIQEHEKLSQKSIEELKRYLGNAEEKWPNFKERNACMPIEEVSE